MAESKRRSGGSARASVVDLAFAVSVLGIPLLAHGRLLNGDGDLARHLVIGRHILERGPRFDDPFSFSRAGEPFLAYEWLSQVIYASVHALAGLPGVAALAGILLATTFALIVRFVRRDGGDPWLAFMTGVVAAIMSSPHWLARPHLFTFLGLAILLHLTGRQGRRLWLIPLFAVWANLHPGFLYGLIMLAVWAVGSVLEDLREHRPVRSAVLDRLAPVGMAVVASFANPFGWTVHTHAVGLMGSDTAGIVQEFMPLSLMTFYGVVITAAAGLVVAGLAAKKEWVGWPVLLVFGAGLFAALAVRRNAPLLALFALPIAARALMPVARSLPSWAFGRMRAEFARSDRPGWRVGAAATATLVVLLAVDAGVERVTLVPGEFSPEVFPAAAVRHARAQGLEGRLLSQYTWGGYVLYSWPGQRVFVDSMADFFGDDLVREYVQMQNARPGWAEKLAANDISLVLFEPEIPLVAALREDPGWRVAHEDEVAVLLMRRDT